MMDPHTQTSEAHPTEAVLRELIYEEMDGQLIYYRGFQDVLNKTKSLDDITGSSHLHSLIVNPLLKYLLVHVEDKGYEVLSHELGLYLRKGDTLAADMLFIKLKLQKKPFLLIHIFRFHPKR